jgi:hypothetical protein
MKANLLPLLALALLLAQCKKRDPDPAPTPADPLAALPAALPAETQTGAGTFGCLVNGKPMSVNSSFLAIGDWTGAITSLRIVGQTSVPQPDYAVQLLLNGRLLNGQIFSLIPHRQNFAGTTNEFGADATTNRYSCNYSGNYIKTGKVELVKFDGPNRIAAGRFAFTLYEPGGCDTLKVTNGRFDVKF